MERSFDYSQKILVAVETGIAPRVVSGLPDSHAVFKRISIPEIIRAFDHGANPLVRLIAGGKFRRVLDQRMGYWEKRVPAGQMCFVHYVRGTESEITLATRAFKALPGRWLTLGTYQVEPQSSAYPFGFPSGPVPDHWHLGEERVATSQSVYWFNFFPAQRFLFEKTFVIWALFSLYQSRERGECNQLVSVDGHGAPSADGVDTFVQINLNRFTNFAGYFASARAAGKQTFTKDHEYLWYGMLLNRFS
ncbi:MAG TPA: hypothetical protein VL354_19715 [Spirochaetia bacterium]|nr:hypothetical protein [Spirochaetia bacterium]